MKILKILAALTLALLAVSATSSYAVTQEEANTAIAGLSMDLSSVWSWVKIAMAGAVVMYGVRKLIGTSNKT